MGLEGFERAKNQLLRLSRASDKIFCQPKARATSNVGCRLTLPSASAASCSQLFPTWPRPLRIPSPSSSLSITLSSSPPQPFTFTPLPGDFQLSSASASDVKALANRDESAERASNRRALRSKICVMDVQEAIRWVSMRRAILQARQIVRAESSR